MSLRTEPGPADADGATRRSPRALAYLADPAERALALLNSMGAQAACEKGRIRIEPGRIAPAQINAALVKEGIAVSHLATESLTLEDVFLELTR